MKQKHRFVMYSYKQNGDKELERRKKRRNTVFKVQNQRKQTMSCMFYLIINYQVITQTTTPHMHLLPALCWMIHAYIHVVRKKTTQKKHVVKQNKTHIFASTRVLKRDWSRGMASQHTRHISTHDDNSSIKYAYILSYKSAVPAWV